MIVVILQIWD